jgi:Tol biopolymer transport system component
MPDVREVFQMTTQKVRPDRGFTERQEFRQRRRVRNRKIGAYVTVAAIAAVAVIAIAAVQDGSGDTMVPGATPPPSAAAPVTSTHAYLDLATGERTPVAPDLSEARLLEVSPNGEAVAYNTCCDDDTISVASLDGSGAEVITPDELDGYGPTWIDDETILFQGRREGTIELGDLYVANLSTGEVTMVTDLPDERNGAWVIVSDVSPDGTTVLFHLPRRAGAGSEDDTKYDLWTAPLSGGEPTLLRKNAGFPQYAADGRIVFIDHAVPFHGDAIWVMEGDGSKARPLVDDRRAELTWPRVSPDGSMVAYGNQGEAYIISIDGGPGVGSGEATGEVSEEPAWFGNDTLIVN